MAKKALGAPDARKAWCKCCDEFSIMCHHESMTSPRYKKMKYQWNEPPPPPLKGWQRCDMEYIHQFNHPPDRGGMVD